MPLGWGARAKSGLAGVRISQKGTQAQLCEGDPRVRGIRPVRAVLDPIRRGQLEDGRVVVGSYQRRKRERDLERDVVCRGRLVLGRQRARRLGVRRGRRERVALCGRGVVSLGCERRGGLCGGGRGDLAAREDVVDHLGEAALGDGLVDGIGGHEEYVVNGADGLEERGLVDEDGGGEDESEEVLDDLEPNRVGGGLGVAGAGGMHDEVHE